jgi:hypothetical protein
MTNHPYPALALNIPNSTLLNTTGLTQKLVANIIDNNVYIDVMIGGRGNR